MGRIFAAMLAADDEATAHQRSPAEALAEAVAAGVAAHHDETGMTADDVDQLLRDAGADLGARECIVESVRAWEVGALSKARTRAVSKAEPAASEVTEQAKQRPAFTLSEAEVVTGASRSTLRRRLAEQAFPNAYTVGKTKQWRIPVEDLLAAGLRVNAPAPGEDVLGEQAQQPAQQPAQSEALALRVAELERLLALEQAKREAAEQLAEERAERVEDLRTAMRLLEVGPLGRAQQQAEQTGTPAGTAAPARRGWFSRRT